MKTTELRRTAGMLAGVVRRLRRIDVQISVGKVNGLREDFWLNIDESFDHTTYTAWHRNWNIGAHYKKWTGYGIS